MPRPTMRVCMVSASEFPCATRRVACFRVTAKSARLATSVTLSKAAFRGGPLAVRRPNKTLTPAFNA